MSVRQLGVVFQRIFFDRFIGGGFIGLLVVAYGQVVFALHRSARRRVGAFLGGCAVGVRNGYRFQGLVVMVRQRIVALLRQGWHTRAALELDKLRAAFQRVTGGQGVHQGEGRQLQAPVAVVAQAAGCVRRQLEGDVMIAIFLRPAIGVGVVFRQGLLGERPFVPGYRADGGAGLGIVDGGCGLAVDKVAVDPALGGAVPSTKGVL